MSGESHTPVYREFVYRSLVSSAPTSEVIQLIAEVMNSFRDISPQEVEGVAAWFAMTYANARINVDATKPAPSGANAAGKSGEKE